MRYPVKHALLVFLLYLAALLPFPSAALAAAGSPALTARSAVLMDAGTGRVYLEKKARLRSEPASLTKIITAIVALEYGHPEEIVTISKKTASICVGQQLNLLRGERLTLENLIKAALIYSANDSTVAIAQHVAGNEERFIEYMNAKAIVLGALETRFANTNGYHNPNHYSTAYDLALITRYALTNSHFSQIVRTPRDTIQWADGEKKREVQNTNQLVREQSYEGILGVKTGSTIRAGDCLIAAASRGDRTLIAVVLHSRNRYRDAVKMLDYGFNEIKPFSLCGKSEDFGQAPVENGVRDSVRAVSSQTVEADMSEEDRDQTAREVTFITPLRAPVRAGQKVGTAVFTLHGEEVGRVELVAAGGVKKKGIIFRVRSLL